MTRDEQRTAGLSRLLLAGAALIVVLLLLPDGDRFSLTLTLVGFVVCFLAVFYALRLLLALLLAATAPKSAVKVEATAGETPAVGDPPAAQDAPPEGAAKAAPVPARPGVLALLYEDLHAFITRYQVAITLVVMIVLFVLVMALSAGNLRQDRLLLEVGLALVAITVLAYLLLPAPSKSQPTNQGLQLDGAAGTKDEQAPTDPLSRLMVWGTNLVNALWSVIEALLMMFVKTATTILPTSARLEDLDRKYNQENKAEMERIVKGFDLPDNEREVMVSYWIKQIIWISGRANRERDANELIRWWQIILSASIPLIGLLPGTEGNRTLFASLAGALMTVLTAMQQFRRPEERWHHYRKLAERMQWEFWSFVNLDKEIYEPALAMAQDVSQASTDRKVRSTAFQIYNNRMIKLREEDMQVFFSQVTPLSQPIQPQGAMQPKADEGKSGDETKKN